MPHNERYLSFRCPRWGELPELELYMDQVLFVLEKNLHLFGESVDDENKKEDDDSKNMTVITQTMVNNYVKNKLIPPPKKKKYSRLHLAYLHIICVGKRILSMTEIKSVLDILTGAYTPEEAYDLFCDEIEHALKYTFGGESPVNADESLEGARRVLSAFAKAFSYKIYAQNAINEIKPEEMEETVKSKEKNKDKDKNKEKNKEKEKDNSKQKNSAE